MRLGYLWLLHFPVQAASHRRPKLRARPLLIVDDPSGLGRVVDAGRDCLALGVTLGMPAGTAAGLLRDPVALCHSPRGFGHETPRERREAAGDWLQTRARAGPTSGRRRYATSGRSTSGVSTRGELTSRLTAYASIASAG